MRPGSLDPFNQALEADHQIQKLPGGLTAAISDCLPKTRFELRANFYNPVAGGDHLLDIGKEFFQKSVGFFFREIAVKCIHGEKRAGRTCDLLRISVGYGAG